MITRGMQAVAGHPAGWRSADGKLWLGNHQGSGKMIDPEQILSPNDQHPARGY